MGPCPFPLSAAFPAPWRRPGHGHLRGGRNAAGGAGAGGGGSCSHAQGHSGRLNWNLNAGHCPQDGQESVLPCGLGQAWTVVTSQPPASQSVPSDPASSVLQAFPWPPPPGCPPGGSSSLTMGVPQNPCQDLVLQTSWPGPRPLWVLRGRTFGGSE